MTRAAGVRAAVVAAAVALHVALGLALDGTTPLPGDRVAFDVIGDLRFNAGVDAARVLTDAGSLPVAVVVVALTAVVVGQRGGRPARALRLVLGFVVVFVLVHVTKDLWDRPRPTHRLQHVFGQSYPSGHSAYAASYVACAVAARGRRLIAAACAVAVAIGLTRLYLHVHFLTDVLGGYALSIAVFAALLRP